MRQTAVLFTWDISIKSGKLKTKIHRELYGYTDYSQFGKYKYQRSGILTNIRHLNPTQSCIIVEEHNAQKIREFFNKYKVKFDERKVLLTDSESRKLSG